MANQLISVYPNTHLGNGHAGLAKLAKTHGENIAKLSDGEFILFMNRSQTAFKLFCSRNVVVHYKHPHGLIHAGVIKYLPSCLNGDSININKALHKVLTKELGKRGIITTDYVDGAAI